MPIGSIDYCRTDTSKDSTSCCKNRNVQGQHRLPKKEESNDSTGRNRKDASRKHSLIAVKIHLGKQIYVQRQHGLQHRLVLDSMQETSKQLRLL